MRRWWEVLWTNEHVFNDFEVNPKALLILQSQREISLKMPSSPWVWVSEGIVLESSYFQLECIAESFHLNFHHLPKVLQLLQGEASPISVMEVSLCGRTGENRTWHIWWAVANEMESRHSCLDLLIIAMSSRGSPASCPSRAEQAPIALFLQDTPCSQAGEWRFFTQDQRDSVPPRTWIRAQVDWSALTDCLSRGLRETHLNKKDLNI